MTTKDLIPVWHAYHNKLLAWIPSVEERRACIQETKPADEHKLRLRLLKEVRQRERLPKALVQARERSVQSWERSVRAWDRYAQAQDRYDQAQERYDQARERSERAWERSERAWDRYERARERSDRAWERCGRARERYDQAQERYKPEIEALHAEECPDCPWDGKTIFSDETKPWRL